MRPLRGECHIAQGSKKRHACGRLSSDQPLDRHQDPVWLRETHSHGEVPLGARVDQSVEVRRRQHPALSGDDLSLDLETELLANPNADGIRVPLLFDLYDAVPQPQKDVSRQRLNPKAEFGRAHPRTQSPQAIRGDVSVTIWVTRQQGSGRRWATSREAGQPSRFRAPSTSAATHGRSRFPAWRRQPGLVDPDLPTFQ